MIKSILKKVLKALVVLFILIVGIDYGKHVYLLHKLKQENPEIVFHGESVILDEMVFRVGADKITFPQGSCELFHLRIPFFSLSNLRIRLDDLESNGVNVEQVRTSLIKNEHGVEIKWAELSGCAYKLGNAVLSADSINLRGTIDNDVMLITLFATHVKRNDSELFNFSMATNLHHAFTNQGKGQIKIRVSNFRRFLNLISEENLTEGLKLSALEAAFGDNVPIPLDLRGRNLYIGPIKLFELPERDPLFK